MTIIQTSSTTLYVYLEREKNAQQKEKQNIVC